MRTERIDWVDTAKALGMVLVFYGHVVYWVSGGGEHAAAFSQFKFIFSFHIPLFFFISGFFWSRKSQSACADIKRIFLRRMIPVFTFALPLLPLWIIHQTTSPG